MRTYLAYYAREERRVEARTPFEAQSKAGTLFGIPGRLQHLVKVRLA